MTKKDKIFLKKDFKREKQQKIYEETKTEWEALGWVVEEYFEGAGLSEAPFIVFKTDNPDAKPGKKSMSSKITEKLHKTPETKPNNSRPSPEKQIKGGDAVAQPNKEEKSADAAEVLKKEPTKKEKIQAFVILLVVIWVISLWVGGVSYDVEDGIAKLEIEVTYNDDLSSAVYTMLKKVYKIAKDDDDIQGIDVTFVMDKYGLSDSYGNEWKDDFEMGIVKFNKKDVDEIRKYEKHYYYTGKETIKFRYSISVCTLKKSFLLNEKCMR